MMHPSNAAYATLHHPAMTSEPRRRKRTGALYHVALAVTVALYYSVTSEALSLSPTKRTTTSHTAATTFSTAPTSLSMLASTDSSPETHFELQVGRALDILRQDYPDILTQAPDYSIYDPHLEVVDPSGVKVHGLKSYRNAFRLLHALVKFIYCSGDSGLTFRMCYDTARHNIRVHWNAVMVPREIFGGSRTTLYVDGISVYEMDRETGNITQHRIEHLLMNNAPVKPKEGVIAALRREHTVTQVPSFYFNDNDDKESYSSGEMRPDFTMQFQSQPLLGRRHGQSLFAVQVPDETDKNKNEDELDWEALERKNKSRKKFGLSPLTPDEFRQLQAQVKQMDVQQKQRAAAAAATATTKPKDSSRPNLLDQLLGNVLEDTCESNFDCERPEICCDFGFKRMCCSAGSLVGHMTEEGKMVPVPVVAGYPPGWGPQDDPQPY